MKITTTILIICIFVGIKAQSNDENNANDNNKRNNNNSGKDQNNGQRGVRMKNGHVYDDEYADYVEKMRKNHNELSADQIAYKENIFKKNRATIKLLKENGEVDFDIGDTNLDDHDPEEVVATRCKLREQPRPRSLPLYTVNPTSTPISASLDLRKFAQPVRDQGNCGSCWAFATVSIIETRNRIKGFNVSLSEQYLVSCDSVDGGCNGGWPTNTLNWIMKKSTDPQIMPLRAIYPYESNTYLNGYNGLCKTFSPSFRKSANISVVSEYYLGGNTNYLKQLLNIYGPVAVAMTVPNTISFTSYKSGVYSGSCATGTYCSGLNHAVVVLGYGRDILKGDYWIVRNSWSLDWGEDGYIRIPIANNRCNMACVAFVMELNQP